MKNTITYNGTERQNKWASDIIQKSKLSADQLDNLLRYAGPKMYDKKIMDVTIIIEHRSNLSEYADSLGEFYKLSKEEKHEVALAAGAVAEIAKLNLQ